MRRLPPDPLSQRAVWSRRIGWFAVAVTVMGVLAMRFGLLPFGQSAAVMAAGAGLALLALLLAVAALVQIWNIGARGLSQAVTGLLLALALLIGPAALAVQAGRTAPLRQVSTDLSAPPHFSRARAALAARGDSEVPDFGPQDAAAQRRAYPDLKPVMLDMPADEAMTLVDSTIEALGWQVVARQPPSRRGAPGHIDAVEKSLVMRLPDDVVVRITPLLERTRIDIRSASRFGDRDFGSNARRLREFMAELDSEARGR